MSEIADIVQIVRIEFEGMQLALKVGSASIKTMQKAAKFLLNLLKYEKSKGQTGLKKLLKRGGDLQVFRFEEKDIKQVEKLCKKFGILYSFVPQLDKDSGLREMLFHAEATPRVNLMLGKLKTPGRAEILTMDKFLSGMDEKKLNNFNEILKEEEELGNPKIHADTPKENLITKVGDYVMDKQTTSVDELKDKLGLSEEEATHAIGRLSSLGAISQTENSRIIMATMDKEEYLRKVGILTELNDRMRSIAADKNLGLETFILDKKLITEETPTQIKVKVPGTDGPEPVYVLLDKKDVVASADGKAFKAGLDTTRSYILLDKRGNQVRSVHGKDLFERHFGKEKQPSQSLIDKFIKEHTRDKKKVR